MPDNNDDFLETVRRLVSKLKSRGVRPEQESVMEEPVMTTELKTETEVTPAILEGLRRLGVGTTAQPIAVGKRGEHIEVMAFPVTLEWYGRMLLGVEPEHRALVDLEHEHSSLSQEYAGMALGQHLVIEDYDQWKLGAMMAAHLTGVIRVSNRVRCEPTVELHHSGWDDLSMKPPEHLVRIFDPVTKHEKILQGEMGKLGPVHIFTEGMAEPRSRSPEYRAYEERSLEQEIRGGLHNSGVRIRMRSKHTFDGRTEVYFNHTVIQALQRRVQESGGSVLLYMTGESSILEEYLSTEEGSKLKHFWDSERSEFMGTPVTRIKGVSPTFFAATDFYGNVVEWTQLFR